MNAHRLLIGVPNKLLLQQWKCDATLLFGDFSILIVASGIDSNYIRDFLKNNNDNCIVITTYASAHKVNKSLKKSKFMFDMKILDEAHHLTANNIKNNESHKKYVKALDIKCEKQLSLTATMKLLDYDNDNNDNMIISNDDEKHFGKIIAKRSLLWAINEKIVCDYVIQTIIVNDKKVNDHATLFDFTDEHEKRLFLSAFSSLKSISEHHTHHILIYSNNRNNAKRIIKYIDALICNNYFNIDDLYYSNYHGEMMSNEKAKIIEKFQTSKYGIISCVYCLGEGWNFPLLDGVVFSENMSSNIRIVQSALRPCRKNINDINKTAKIILPFLDMNDDEHCDNDMSSTFTCKQNDDFKKVREIIHQMGLEDESITHKIKVYDIAIEKEYSEEINEDDNTCARKTYNMFEYNDEMTQILRLKTKKRMMDNKNVTIYDEAKKIIRLNNIKSKRDYYELCDKDIRLSKDPDLLFGNNFIGWIDYLSLNNMHYDHETCKNKVKEYIETHYYLRKYMSDINQFINKLCQIDMLFPACDLWQHCYDMNYIYDIMNARIMNNKKSAGAMI
jgi:predicted helicase